MVNPASIWKKSLVDSDPPTVYYYADWNRIQDLKHAGALKVSTLSGIEDVIPIHTEDGFSAYLRAEEFNLYYTNQVFFTTGLVKEAWSCEMGDRGDAMPKYVFRIIKT